MPVQQGRELVQAGGLLACGAARAQQGLASAIRPGLALALSPKGPGTNEADGKLWWRLTTGLHLSAMPTSHGNGPADAWEAVWHPVFPPSLYFSLWRYSLQALT